MGSLESFIKDGENHHILNADGKTPREEGKSEAVRDLYTWKGCP